MDERITAYVGLDAHAQSTAIAVAAADMSAPQFVGTVGARFGELAKALGRLGKPGALQILYEAGPCGFALARQLRHAGYACEVVAPSKVPRRAGDRVKTDRRDALMLAGLARAAQLTYVLVPDERDEAIRDLSRARIGVLRFVERHVESLFFHQWHSNEAALRRFVKEAAFVTKTQALRAAFVSELNRFSGGAPAALYVLGGEDEYRRAEGSLSGGSETIDANDPALVTLRATRAPVELDETRWALPAVLALPMTHRDELSGLVLLGAKPSGEGYRPDEIQLLGATTQQIGLDLHALRVAQLEQELSVLRQRNATLTDLIALRRTLGDAPGAT